MSGFELTFNWFYADSKHIAMYSSGRLPLRNPNVNPGLPTNGNGSYEWRGWLAPNAHVHVVDVRCREERRQPQAATPSLQKEARAAEQQG